jgi:RNAse (barnase) inhibitor barstar
MCKLLKVHRINSTAFNPKMQGKVERFHAGLNQTMSQYVNKYGNGWDDYVDYVLMVHRSTPLTITKYSPYYLFHGRDMRLPCENDLTAQMEMSDDKSESQNNVASHIDALADNLKEALEVVWKLNKISRAKQKAYYDRYTKLITYSEGYFTYLKEMA